MYTINILITTAKDSKRREISRHININSWEFKVRIQLNRYYSSDTDSSIPLP